MAAAEMPPGSNEMPPVSNRFLYMYRVAMKWAAFFLFGLGTVILAVMVFPVMRLWPCSREEFQKHARCLVSAVLRFFVLIMDGMGIVKLDVDDPGAYRCLISKIVVANHPSLLDVVMLFALIPNADCIVQGALSRTIVRGVIRQLYIPNSLKFEELIAECTGSLDRGNCIIIFPEGTRTPRSGGLKIKKGAARLSLASGYGIIPVHIGGTDKYGLGKRDPWGGFNHEDKYIYRIRMQDELSPGRYADIAVPLAVRRLNGEIRDILLNPSKT
jgi:1-acyl-sn-glycerol-3-phosphate acyltransferase